MLFKTPPIDTKIINSIPVFISASIATCVIGYYEVYHFFAPVMLGIIAGGLVDLDNGLTGKFKNILYAIVAFSVVSLAVQLTYPYPILLILTLTATAFIFTMLGAAGVRFRTVSFGVLAVAIYTILTHDPKMTWYLNSLSLVVGTSLYSGCTLLTHLFFPHRPVQENMANAYDALSDCLDAKADFFDPDEVEQLEQQQIKLAMSNSQVITAFNQCREALFYRMRGQHRHPRTTQMLHYYFIAQDIHERINSSYINYKVFVPQMRHTDLIYRIQRLIKLQANACRTFAQNLRQNHDYQNPPQLDRATKGVAKSLNWYATHTPDNGASPYSVQQLLENLSRISLQFSQLGSLKSENLVQTNEKTRIHISDARNFHHAWRALRQHSTLQSATFRHAVRMAIITFICCISVQIIAKFQLNQNDLSFGYWILLTAVFVCQPNYTTTKTRLLHRIYGTVGGVLVGSTIALIPMSMVVQMTIAVLALTLFFFTRTNKYSYSTFFITIQAMMGFAIMGFDVSGFFVPRIIDTLLGAAIAGFAVYYLWADWKYLSLDKTSVHAIHSNAAYLEAVLAELQNGISNDVAYRVARRNSHEQAATLSSVLSDMALNPDKHQQQLDSGFKLLKTNYALISHISALGSYRDNIHTDNATEQHFLLLFYPAANSIVHILRHINTWNENDFQAALTQLHTQLNQLNHWVETQENEQNQNNILFYQLIMINELLPTVFQTLQSCAETA
ncbi:YccS family putative transporter [Wielerella bovis]|uniref:YccS family putative transporter n=1 Tax=Wielerella bovis TaxID=2917790 RepID=UPI00201902B2|nr:YccS family putative transporter [Wielerella bovis]MCG7656780.1 YccS family putative transporter [Wielerella bovis]MCG7659003.1 YccS family putative transporter [Wielerella bovis]